MPRPKGSRNKKTMTIAEQIAAAEARVSELREALAAAERELEALKALNDEAKVKSLVDAIATSGRSIDDVIAMVKGGEEAPGAEWL